MTTLPVRQGWIGAALAGALVAGGAPIAEAGEDGWKKHRHHHHHGYAPYGYYYAKPPKPPRAYYYAPPVVYAPPPVAYGPPAYYVPAQPPGINLGITVPLR